MKIIFLALTFLLLCQSNVLQEYVNRPDPNFSYRLYNTTSYAGGNVYFLNVTTHKWLTSQETNHPIWWNLVVIYRPNVVSHRTGIVFIEGGSSTSRPNVRNDIALASVQTQSIVTLIYQTPNQPITFAGQNRVRFEDDLIAHTWAIFLKTGKSDYIAQLPMVKGVVKSIEATQDYLRKEHQNIVEKFVVAGASKRGWTTWLTSAAIPHKIAAIIPIVIPVLDTIKVMRHIYKSYCFWPLSLRDYENEGVTKLLHTQMMLNLTKVVDPLNYRDILTFPKYIINGVGDQFFASDTTQFFFNSLLGEKHIRDIPNADHSLSGTDAFFSVISYYNQILSGAPRPNFVWDNQYFEKHALLKIRTAEEPISVKLWMAENPIARDFRVEIIGKVWNSTTLTSQGNGVYEATIPHANKGFRAYLIEVQYKSRTFIPLTFTTSTFIVPNQLPCTEP